MIAVTQKDNFTVIDFSTLEDWNSFDKILSLLKEHFDAKIVEQIEGPESRVCFINIHDHIFSLHNNPYGNYLKPRNSASNKLIQELLPKFKEIF